ncbi:hypothetical protein ANRL4_00627 [Anaerolineae bacterium]|nr:hypothetical protein ANRL4_00627 [Anaerolineae bacterium]
MRRLALIVLVAAVLGACGAPPRSTPTPSEAGGETPTAASGLPTTEPTVVVPPTNTPAESTGGAATPLPVTQPPDQPTAVPATEVVAVQPTVEPTPAETPTPAPPTPLPAPSGQGVRALVWNPNVPGLVWYAQDGTVSPAAQAGSTRSLAIPCLISGGWLAFHLGGDTKGAQVMYDLNSGATLALGENHGVSCSIHTGIQLSPDGARLGLLRVGENAPREAFLAGALEVRSFPGGELQNTIRDVTAYALYNDGALILQFFPNSDGDATAADLRWWDGGAERVIEQEIKPLEDCVFVHGRVLRVGDSVFTLVGERCGRRTNWRLIRSAFGGGSSTNLAQGEAGGVYFTTSGTNDLYLLPGGSELLIVVPNGLNLEVANLIRVNLSDGSTQPMLSGVVVDRHPPNALKRFVFSADGNRLALVTRDGNGAEKLYVYDLTQPANSPVEVAGGNRSDRIGAVVWSYTGSRLYYVISGDTNAVSYLDLDSGEKRLVMRGTFTGLAVSPDGRTLVTARQNKVADNDIRHNLSLITIENGSETILLEGAKGEIAPVPLVMAGQ